MFRRWERVKPPQIVVASKDIITGNRVTKGTYMNRLNTCRDCVLFIKKLHMCRMCGCFMPLKAMAPSSDCPKGKWSTCESGVNATKQNTGAEDTNQEE